MLTGGRRRRSRDRQRTLRETVDWSHDLLEPDEQEAFAKLSVFAGSFGLDGAVVVLMLSLVEVDGAAVLLLAPVKVNGHPRSVIKITSVVKVTVVFNLFKQVQIKKLQI